MKQHKTYTSFHKNKELVPFHFNTKSKPHWGGEIKGNNSLICFASLLKENHSFIKCGLDVRIVHGEDSE